MSKMKTGYIRLAGLGELQKKGHSAFFKNKKGELCVSVVMWENDAPDQYGNTCSIQLSSSKEKRESEDKVYIGNLKPVGSNVNTNTPTPPAIPEAAADPNDDLPF